MSLKIFWKTSAQANKFLYGPISLTNVYDGATLLDFSKAFDTINHDLLISKLHVYDFSKSLKLIKSYSSNRWQRTKLNIGFSKWTEILTGVPQGSIFGRLLFNIYINDSFFLTENNNVCNHADDTTFYACDSDLHNLISKLEHHSVSAFNDLNVTTWN